MPTPERVPISAAPASAPRGRVDGGAPTAIDAPARPRADTPIGRFLVGAADEPPPLAEARAHLVSAHVLERRPDHPDRDALRVDARYAATRHLAIASQVRTLIRAWNDLGIEPLVLKGFHLAEFVYSSAALRPYHDVDLVLEPDQVPRALAAVGALGWEVAWRVDAPDHLRSARASGYHGHEAAQLRHPAIDLVVDVHRRVAHNNHNRLPSCRPQQRLTDALRRDAEAIDWDGVRLRRPRPVDAVVFGLALNRCWGSDAWRVKARDYLDLATLARRFTLSRPAILARARDLGVRRTVETYLERCDPFRGRLLLRAPSWWELRAWNLRVAPERGPYDPQRAAVAAFEGVHAGLALAHSWRYVRDARRAVVNGASIADWRARHPLRPASAAVDSRRWRELRRALHRLQRLDRPPADDRPAVAALAAYAWLRRRGLDAELRPRSPGADDAASAELWWDGAPLDAAAAVERDGA